MALTKKKTSGGGTTTFDLAAYAKKMKSKIGSALKRAKEDDGGLPQFDDGRYRMRVIKAEAGKSQNGRPQVVTFYKFLNGDYKGKEYRSYRGIENEDQIFYFLNDVKRLGFDIDALEIEEIPDLLTQMGKDKPIVLANLKTKEGKDGNEYQNLQIVRVVDEDDDEDEAEDDEPKAKKKSGTPADAGDEDEDEAPKKKAKKKKPAADDDDEDEDDDDDEADDEDDEEEEEKPAKKKKAKKADDDDDEEAEEDDEADDDAVPVTVGSIVTVKLKSGKQKCEVTDILEDENAIKVKTDEGKTVRLDASRILAVEEPKKKKSKK